MFFDLEPAEMLIVAVLIAIVLFFRWRAIRGTACPKCGKMFAMKEISRERASTSATTVDVERKVRDRNGKVIRTYTEAVPATRFVYDCVDECKYCGRRREVQREYTLRS